MSEPFGTTPLPVALDPSEAFTTLHVLYDPSIAIGSNASRLQQPIQQEIASFTAENADYSLNGAAVVAVNQHFVIYAVKKGLIRVLHRHSSMKSLFRQHQNETVSDIQIFQNGEVLASVSASGNGPSLTSKAVIWRVYERTSDIMTSPLLEIHSRSIRMVRVIWHPSDMNQFWLIHSRSVSQDLLLMATLVNTTRITTKPDPSSNHPMADFGSPATLLQEPTVLFSDELSSSLKDMSWCGSDSQYALAAYDNGDIVLYDLKSTAVHPAPDDGILNIARPALLQKVNQGSAVTRCIMLPHYDALSSINMNGTDPTMNQQILPYSSCFLTGGEGNNAEVTLWSAFSPGVPPAKFQVVRISSPSCSYVLNTCFGPAPATGAPPSCFVTACCREFGAVYAFHLKAAWSLNQRPLLVGSDYVVPFSTKYPILSSTVTCAPAADISEEVLVEQGGIIFDMKLFVYQTMTVQCLTLTSYMCLPPAHTFTEFTAGVTVNRSLGVAIPEALSGAVKDLPPVESASDVMAVFSDEFEDYDVDDDDVDCIDSPDPSSLPLPNDVTLEVASSVLPGSNNPFANWLGAVAVKPLENPVKPSSDVSQVKQANANPVPSMMGSTAPPNPMQKSTLLSPMEILGMIPVVSTSPVNQTAKTASDAKQSPKRTNGSEVHENVETEYSTSGQSPFSSEMQAAVHDVMQSVVVPLIRRELANIAEPMSLTLPAVRDSVEQLVRQLDDVTLLNSNRVDSYTSALVLSLQEPFRAAFTECIRNILLPAMESVTSQVYATVCKRIDDTFPSIGKGDEKMESISKQLTTMTSLVTELTKEVNVLRTMIANTPSIQAPLNATSMQGTIMKTSVDPFDEQRSEILQFLKDKNFEMAFRRSVANTTVDMTIFCCQKAPLLEVFASGQAKLSQPILLCVMQQLGTILVSSSDLLFVLEWLQEIALSLYPPVDPQIRPHLPIVVKQVAVSLSERMEHDINELALQRSLRKLQSLLRGMLL